MRGERRFFWLQMFQSISGRRQRTAHITKAMKQRQNACTSWMLPLHSYSVQVPDDGMTPPMLSVGFLMLTLLEHFIILQMSLLNSWLLLCPTKLLIKANHYESIFCQLGSKMHLFKQQHPILDIKKNMPTSIL